MITTDEKIHLLSAVPVFQEMSEDEVRLLAGISQVHYYEDQDRILKEGDRPGTLFVIATGTVAITRDNPGDPGSYTHLATLGTGEYFAEMSLFDNQPASASGFAFEGPCEVLHVQKELFLKIMDENPSLARGLFNFLCQRLRAANARIAQYEEALAEYQG